MGVRVWHGKGDPEENIAGWYCSTSGATLEMPIFSSHWAAEQAMACLRWLGREGDVRKLPADQRSAFILKWMRKHICSNCSGNGCLQMGIDDPDPECRQGMVNL